MSETAVNGVEPIIFLDDVHVTFRTRTGSILHPNLVHAVQGVTIRLMPGQTIGIVGESGCGKSTTATVMFITMGATLFGYVLTRARLDLAIKDFMLNITGGSTVIFFIIVNIVLLIAGCFLDSTSALYIFTPLFAPVALQLGIDPIHLGTVMIVNLAIGLFTPPVGVNLYVACGIGDIKIEEITKGIIPCLLAELAVLLLVTYIPDLSLMFVG